MALADGKWVCLEGEAFDIRELTDAFGDPPQVVFAQTDDGRWWMTSDSFDPIEDAAEIRSVAVDLIGTLNGCARVLWENHMPVSTGNVVRFKDSDDGRNEQVVLVGPAVSRERAGMLTVIGGRQPLGPPPRISWLRAALANPDVASALRIIGKAEPTWSELYHLIELVETLTGQTVSAAGWTSDGTLTRFRRTANSRRAIGEEARHGHSSHQPPANPMSLSEAREMARTATEGFLNSLI